MQPSLIRYSGLVLIILFLACTTSAAQENLNTPGTREVHIENIPELLQSIKNYQWGDSREPMARIEEALRSAVDEPSKIAHAEREFIEFLKTEASLAAKQFVCEKLSIYGTAQAVPVLEKMLNVPETEEMALFALERISDKSVLSVLHKALKKSSGKSQVALINAIAAQKNPESVDLLSVYAESNNNDVARAAVKAIGRIGGKKAEKYLEKRLAKTDDKLRSELLFAFLTCAESYREAGKTEDAIKVYTTLLDKTDLEPVQFAAVRGLLILEPETASGRLNQLMQSGDDVKARLAIRLVNVLPEGQNIEGFIAHREALSPALQIELITVLSDRSDPAITAMLMKATDSPDENVRLTALNAMGNKGDPALVSVLVQKASAGTGQERRIARESLVAMQGRQVDEQLVKMLGQVDDMLKVEVIRTIGERYYEDAARALVPFLNHPDSDIRIAAVRSLRDIGGMDELDALLVRMTGPGSAKERDELKKTVNAVLQKQTTPDLKLVLNYLEKTKTNEDRMAFYDLLGASGDPAAIPQLHKSLTKDPPELRIAAIKAIDQWPDHTFMKDLWAIASSATDEKTRVLALRGYVRTIPLDTKSTDEEKSGFYEKAMKLARTTSDKQLILSGVAETPSIQAFRFVDRFLESEALRREAEAAMVKIAAGLPSLFASEVIDGIQKISGNSENEALTEQKERIVQRMEQLDGYMTAWLAAGPYSQKEGNLLDVEFPPEKETGQPVEWVRLASNPDPDRYWYLPLDLQFGGDDRVIYLKNKVWSGEEREARLEVGSDDGIKVWLNGEMLHRLDAPRGVTPGEDKISVRLRKGWNDLIMKISNNAGGFGACARFRNPDGSRISGLKAELPE